MDQAEKLRNVVRKKNQSQERFKTARTITVASGKGGVGKSNIAINLAIQFQKIGQRVIIFDADFGLANIEIMFGAIPKYNLSDVVFGGKSLVDIMTEGPYGIKFISGGSGIDALANMSKDNLEYLSSKLTELDEMADVIIIDTGAGISDSVIDFIVSSKEVLLVTTPEPTSITDAYALLKTLNAREDFNTKDTIIKVITNKTSSYDEGRTLYNNLSIVVSKFLDVNIEFLGSIPNDRNVSRAIMKQNPVSYEYPNSGASRAIVDMCNLLYGNEPSQDEKMGITKFFTNLIFNRQNKNRSI